MALMNDMQSYKLQKSVEIETPSGQKKKDWTDITEIKVAVYLIDEMSVIGSVRYDQYDCAGLTFYKGFEKKEKYRMVAGDEIYIVERVVTSGCRIHLLLKRFENGK